MEFILGFIIGSFIVISVQLIENKDDWRKE